jgi:predicted ribosome quality control (RQC) complex YloA/Tae2 family protein
VPVDGITLGALARELDGLLRGGRVEKLQQPERDEVLLTIRAGGENRRLLLSCSPNAGRALLQKAAVQSPNSPPQFCMLLRKHLGSARVLGVEQEGADRVLTFRFEALNDLGDPCEKRLVLEIMGRHSNLILVSEMGRIVDAARHVGLSQSRVREVLPGFPYEPAPAQAKLNPYLAAANEYSVAFLPLVGQKMHKAIAQVVSGISPQLAKELAFRFSGGNSEAELGFDLVPGLCEGLERLLTDLRAAPTLLLDEFGEPLDFTPFPYLSRAAERQRAMESMSEAAETCFFLRQRRERLNQRAANLRRYLQNQLERCEKKRALQLETAKEVESRDELRKKGELLTAQLYAVERGAPYAELSDYYDENMATIRIDLNPALSPAENAQRYFKQYAKMRSAAELLSGQIDENGRELSYFEGQLVNLENCETIEELAEIRLELEREGYLKPSEKARQKKQDAPSRPLEFRSSAGIPIFVGKNNLQNDRLTFSAGPDETWLHVKDRPGSHVILRSTRPDRQSLLEAASLAAYFSRSRLSANVPVDHCARKFVKKPSGAKPGYVIYSNQSTLFVTPEESLAKRLAIKE